MKRFLKWMLVSVLLASPVFAEQRVIVRALGGTATMNTACLLLGCNVLRGLDDPLSQLVVVRIPVGKNLVTFINQLTGMLGIINVEPDRIVTLAQSPPQIPAELYDTQEMPYFGTNVRRGYVLQPAAQIVRMAEARSTFSVTGTATVAVIDTGVDPDHPVLQPVLLSGYDYTRGLLHTASETGDVSQSTAAVVDGVPPVRVNQSTAAVVDQSTAAVVDDPDHVAFGHGTMVAGIIHLVSPEAKILPLKAFRSDGTGYTSDILRAIYRAIGQGARVINMSFSMPASSLELKIAVDLASLLGTICVASVGNDGIATTVYPAAWSNVLGVASTTNDDRRSNFSNYGENLVSLAAPGEGVVTTYPFGTYAAAWGTSFSTPIVSGTVALLLDKRPNLTVPQASAAIRDAVPLGPELGNGRLDIVEALNAVQAMQ